jgi:chemotaxis protein methyltransferase CheR
VPRLNVFGEFFFDLDRWQALRGELLPPLIEKRGSLRAWSAGCHIGKESYSLAMLLRELDTAHEHRVFASDRDARAVNTARQGGPYPQEDLKNLTRGQVGRWFVRRDGLYYVGSELRERVTHCRHDLVSDTLFAFDFDLVCFRNVEPYFNEDALQVVLARLYDAIHDDGLLFVGSTDRTVAFDGRLFERVDRCFYMKRGAQ